jgi:hypothetical protein
VKRNEKISGLIYRNVLFCQFFFDRVWPVSRAAETRSQRRGETGARARAVERNQHQHKHHHHEYHHDTGTRESSTGTRESSTGTRESSTGTGEKVVFPSGYIPSGVYPESFRTGKEGS